MKGIYEAVVVTSDGTYRAYVFAKTEVFVLEDDLPGIADRFEVADYGGNASYPESLLDALMAWIQENRRGLSVLEARLTLGN
jgi:membrane protease subunit (stomatin/prohibitin family)